ncbi:hypothetical protein ACH4SP_06295 [Streptomyces sp. NPDC021093]|uniref:hypothetical protein n=1 Tax=Streptomyces sp. NPDC021093 TaxID=3365112 RepID=UPI003789A3BC
MDPLLVLFLSLGAVLTVLIVAAAGVLVVRFALRDAKSQDRAGILTAAAEVVRAFRGRR